MRDFARSVMRLPLSFSLFGMKHLAGVFMPSAGHTGLSDGLFVEVEAQFGRLMREAFKASDHVRVMDPLLGALTQNGLSSGHLFKTGFDVTKLLAERIGPYMPGVDNDLAWRELGNKLQSFGTFRYVASMLDLDDQEGFAQWLAKTVGLDPYVRVWATEGLGHYYAEKAWEKGRPEGLLQDHTLPEHSLVALHAGLGLSFGKHVLADLTDAKSDLQTSLKLFVELCQANAKVGYAGVAIEGLGLVVQTFYPHLLLSVDRQLSQVYPEYLGFFWHGVGRGCYFMLRSASAWRKADLMRLQAPHALGRLNLISGLAWPLTLVNIRHPEIMAQFIAHHGEILSQNESFSNGVCASLMVWFNITGGDDYLNGFCNYEIQGNNRALMHHWDTLIVKPSQEAFRTHYPVVKQRACFEALFQK
jgi:hypothetical protein